MAALIGFATVEIEMEQEPPHYLMFHYRRVVEQITFTTGSEMAGLLTATDPPQGVDSIRRHWKTEPEVKRAWKATIDKGRRYRRTM
ncbi:hypothetical protein [Streptomyces sp. BH055]|uniref:hypothetical protein n=1 Tax=Streptomyces sp. BH055 TaxID=3401173 RepID=UPI003BB61ED0